MQMQPQLVTPDAGKFCGRDVWCSKFNIGDVNLCRSWGGALIGQCINCLLSSIESVFTHVTSIYANLLEQEKAFTKEKRSTPTELVWNTSIIKDHCAESTKKH